MPHWNGWLLLVTVRHLSENNHDTARVLRYYERMRYRHVLYGILIVAFLVRIVGISYGLPLWLVADEPPFVIGALKMVELKTLVPAFHADIFRNVLYFPPYISYLYLPFFVLVMAAKFLFFHGSFSIFKDVIIADPSWLFLVARFLSVMFGVGTVWLVYVTGKNIFRKEPPALLSAAFLALSYLHVDFSHWGRHWVPATFFFALVIYVLSRDDYAIKKKYLTASLVAGIGVGINYQVGLAALFIVLWFFFYDRLSVVKYLKKPLIYESVALFGALAAIAYFLYPDGLVVSQESAFGIAKSFGGYLGGFSFYFWKMLETEPAFLLFILAGFVMSFLRHRRYFWVAAGFAFSYVTAFYVLFFNMDRYILMLYPVFALTAGYGLYTIWERARNGFKPLVVILGMGAFLVMGATIMKFDILLWKNDSRIQALQWVERSVPSGTKIIMLARLTRIPSLPDAIAAQERIDPASLRTVDGVERKMPPTLSGIPHYYALNLYTVNSQDFFNHLDDYMKKNNYQYIVYSPEFVARNRTDTAFTGRGAEVAAFSGFQDNSNDITNGFGGGLVNIFRIKNNGPTILVRKFF